MNLASIDSLRIERETKTGAEISWVDGPQRMLELAKTLERVAKRLGDTEEAAEILSVISKVEEINSQFSSAFDAAIMEALNAETGLGLFISVLSLNGVEQLPAEELACLLKPLHCQLKDTLLIANAAARG